MAPLPTLVTVEAYGPSTDADGWSHNRFKMRLRFEGRQMTFPYMMGMGHRYSPDLGNVMPSLLMEAGTAEQFGPADVWEFASEFGYEIDDQTSHDRYAKMLRQIHTQTDKLSNLIGRGMMLALLEDEDATYGSTERFVAAWNRLSD